jgi:hypothetical protein
MLQKFILAAVTVVAICLGSVVTIHALDQDPLDGLETKDKAGKLVTFAEDTLKRP